MNEIISVGVGKYEVLEKYDRVMKLRSMTTGIVREADELFVRFGFCTRQEYLCGFLLYEPLVGFDEDFVCVPTKLWWTDIIDLIINSIVELRLVTSLSWRISVLGLQELQRIFGRLESVEQIGFDKWKVVCGGIEVMYHPLTLAKEDILGLEDAVKLKSIVETKYRIENEKPTERFGVTIKLCYRDIDNELYYVKVDNDILELTESAWKSLIDFFYFREGRRFYDNGKIYHYREGKRMAYDCRTGDVLNV